MSSEQILIICIFKCEFLITSSCMSSKQILIICISSIMSLYIYFCKLIEIREFNLNAHFIVKNFICKCSNL